MALRTAEGHPYLFLVLTPLGFLLCWGVATFVSPASAGSGIPQLIASLKAMPEDFSVASRLLSVRAIVAKVVGTCLAIVSGGVVGREGPMLQISGGIFHLVYRKWPGNRASLDLRSMILAGGASGLAAAFNTPLGGIVFAVEELSKVHLSQIRAYILHAVIIAGLLAEGVMGSYIYLGRAAVADSSFIRVFGLAPIAFVIGGLGALFGIALRKVVLFRSGRSLVIQALFAVALGFVVAALGIMLGGKNLGAGRELIVHLLRSPSDSASMWLAVGRPFANFLTYATGSAGGIFAPSLASGAALGSLASQLLPLFDPQILVLVGMASFLTGVTQTPITSSVLVLEMTDGHRAIFSIMLAALCAQGASRLIQPHSFYELMSKRLLDLHSVGPDSKSS